jgi:adenylate cyclase
MVDFVVLPDDRPDIVRTKRLFTAAMWASIVTSTLSVYQLWVAEVPWAAVAVSVPILAAVVSLVAMRIDPSTFPGVMHVVAAATMGTTAAMIVLFGGIAESANNTAWSILAVIGAVALFADRRAHFWLGVFVVSTIGAFLVTRVVDPLYELPSRAYFALFNTLAVSVFVYGILYYFVRQSARLYNQSESLLRNILPAPIAERLKHSNEMIADEFDSASILFADVAGFTPMSASMEPSEVIELLNEVFTVFDGMVSERRLEKIKTIGDAYMVAAGVPVPREDHARAMCDLALAMQEYLGGHRFAGHDLQMRVGIASGPVMAGIIGHQKFSYDLWGDTVNLASRMESSGVPGRIQLTEGTCLLVRDWFECEARGLVDIKGKGPTATWFLVRPRAG